MHLRTRIAGLLLGLLGVAWLGAPHVNAADSSDDNTKSGKKITVAAIDLDGDLPETNTQAGLFGEITPSLRDIAERLDKAEHDKNVKAVLLRIRSPQIGRGKVDELRAAIAKVRKSGKKVYADLQMAMPSDYLLATACDEIVMPESGTLVIPGVRAEVTFFKNLFEKIGVQADILQVGKFKGAGEPFTRSKMTDEFRAEIESIVGDVYEQMVDTIVTTRKLDADKVRELLDDGMFTAKRAKELGLIDRVAYEDELRAEIRKANGGGELSVINKYGKKKVDADFSGLGGLFKLIEVLSGQESGSMSLAKHKVAVVYAVGTIMSGESEHGLLGGGEGTMGDVTIIKALRTAEKDERVKAIVLRVDSPGGSAMASDLMWREIVHCKKPIVASMGDVAASGGYYISMGTKKIFAEPGTLTGSIGVVGGKLALGGLLGKVGITTDVVSKGRNSGLFSMSEPFTPTQRTTIQRLMTDTYIQFTTKAAEGRKMDLKKLEGLAQGRVYSGVQAKKVGLVDEIGTLEDAIAAARTMGGIPADEKIDLLILPKPKSFFEQLLDGPTVETKMGQHVKAALPALAAPLSDAESLLQLFREPTLTVMPCTIRIR